MSSGDTARDSAAACDKGTTVISSETSGNSDDLKIAAPAVSEENNSVSIDKIHQEESADHASTRDHTKDLDNTAGHDLLTNIDHSKDENLHKTLIKTDTMQKYDKTAIDQTSSTKSSDSLIPTKEHLVKENKTVLDNDCVADIHENLKDIKSQGPKTDDKVSPNEGSTSNNDTSVESQENTTLDSKEVTSATCNDRDISFESIQPVSITESSTNIKDAETDEINLDFMEESVVKDSPMTIKTLPEHNLSSSDSMNVSSSDVTVTNKSSKESMEMGPVEYLSQAKILHQSSNESINLEPANIMIPAKSPSIDSVEIAFMDDLVSANKTSSIKSSTSGSSMNLAPDTITTLTGSSSADSMDISVVQEVCIDNKKLALDDKIIFKDGVQSTDARKDNNGEEINNVKPAQIASQNLPKELNQQVTNMETSIEKDPVPKSLEHLSVDKKSTEKGDPIKLLEKTSSDSLIFTLSSDKSVSSDKLQSEDQNKEDPDMSLESIDSEFALKWDDDDSDQPIDNSADKDAKTPVEVELLKIDKELAIDKVNNDESGVKSDETVSNLIETPITIDSVSGIDSSKSDDDKMRVNTSSDSVDNLLANLDEMIEDSDKNISSVKEKPAVNVTTEDSYVIKEAGLISDSQVTDINMSIHNKIGSDVMEKDITGGITSEANTILSESSKSSEINTKEQKTDTEHKDTLKIETQLTEITSKDSSDLKSSAAQVHRLTEPNIMIEIPSQDLIDIDDSLNKNDDTNQSINDLKQKEGINLDYSIGTLVTELDNKVSTTDKEMEVDSLETVSDDTAPALSMQDSELQPKIAIKSELQLNEEKSITQVSKPEHSVTDKLKNIDPADINDSTEVITDEALVKGTTEGSEADTSKTKTETKDLEPESIEIENMEDDTSTNKEETLPKVIDSLTNTEIAKETETTPKDVSTCSKEIPTPTIDSDPVSTNTVKTTYLTEDTPILKDTSIIKEDEKTSELINNSTKDKEFEPVPSTSSADIVPDNLTDVLNRLEEVPEVTDTMDSLGLLAESSRIMDDGDDDDPDTPEEDDDDEDGDPNYDESSNMAEHSDNQSEDISDEASEDSNEPKLPKSSFNIEENSSDYKGSDENSMTNTTVKMHGFSFSVENSVTSDIDISETTVEASKLDVSMTVQDNTETVVEGGLDISVKDVKGKEDLETIACDDADVASETMASDIDISEVELEAAVQSIDADKDIADGDDKDSKDKSPAVESSGSSPTNSKSKNKILESLLAKDSKLEDMAKETTSKTKNLAMSKPKDFVNIVDLEESSSEDDVQISTEKLPEDSEKVTSVNLPSGIDIDIMSSKQIVSDITTKEGEIIISGVPKPKPSQHKVMEENDVSESGNSNILSPVRKCYKRRKRYTDNIRRKQIKISKVKNREKAKARLNTSELTIKTSSNASADSTLVIPETKIGETHMKRSASKISLEVFSLDSDSDESAPAKEKESARTKKPTGKQEKKKSKRKCVNLKCKSGMDVKYYPANYSVMNYFECSKKKGLVCHNCSEELDRRSSALIEGIKSFTPLLDLEMKEITPELVEISDSDSDEEHEEVADEIIGLDALKLESRLAEILNATWEKYGMDDRLEQAQESINQEIAQLEKENAEIHRLFDECQLATDILREDLYKTFEPEKETLPPVVIYDTNDTVFLCPETRNPEMTQYETRSSKRKLSSDKETESASKRPAIPLGYAPLDKDKNTSTADIPAASAPTDTKTETKVEEDKDVSVVELSIEAAPADLPPAGELSRPALTPAAVVFAMRNAFGCWIRARVVEITPKGTHPQNQFTIVRVKFESKVSKNPYKVLPARNIAYYEPADVRMTIGTRCIALFKDNNSAIKRESFYSGVVAEVPNPVNKFRYLVFFDDGYAQYVHHKDTRLVVESSSLVWEEVHPYSREFVREYLLAYPERPMVRLHKGQNINTEWNGKWWVSKVIEVDASLVHVHFQEDARTEWIYRGSTRLAPLYIELQTAERSRNRPLPRNIQRRTNMPYVEYTRSDEQEAKKAEAERKRLTQERLEQEIRNQRAVAKKSTAPAPVPAPASANLDAVTSRVVYYTPKNAVRPWKYVTHTCSPKCKRTDVLALNDLRTYNPLAKPLLSGWERQLTRFKGHKEVMYRAPCGRRLRDVQDLHKYLRITQSEMGVDLFDFSAGTHCLAEFVLNKCIVGKKDLSHGKENVPVPCVNYYDDSLPEFCSYNTERTPTAGVPLNIDPDFLCGCDCTDDCMDKSKCACWKMTLEGARTIGMDPRKVGYVYKRLPEPLPSGIYECNSRCKCRKTCLNRVAQHPLQLKLQVFKTLNRGWGIRALNDVPKGGFICVYAGNLLTDATANLDGLNEGDEYLAELDYIEVVEQMKEGYEDDIPEKDKKLDKKESNQESSEEELSSSEDEEPSKSDKDDENFQPGYIPQPTGQTEFQKRLRRRDKKVKEDAAKGETEKRDGKNEKGDKGDKDDCITISDDEELREPSRFMAQAGMGDEKFISKYQSVRALYGKDEACYIMDAKVQGNIGRYLNHSCTPNVFVQNVFVDTHDPRFPWVAFFALSHVKAGTELTWNYNYDIGSVPGKTLYCYCGAPNCRGRLL